MALQAIMLTGVAIMMLAIYLTNDLVMWNHSLHIYSRRKNSTSSRRTAMATATILRKRDNSIFFMAGKVLMG